MKIISFEKIRDLNITPSQCMSWIKESFLLKDKSQLPAKISVHPKGTDFFTSMPCFIPAKCDKEVSYFGCKVVHRIEGRIPSLGSDMLLYNAEKGNLLALIDTDWITTMRTGAVAALTAKLLRKKNSYKYGFIGLGNTARATLLCVLGEEPNKYIEVNLLKYKNQADLFIKRFEDYHNVKFNIVDNINDLVKSVDVLFSCITSANGLLIDDVNKYPSGITIIPVHMRGFQNCDIVFDRVLGDDASHVCGFQYFNQFKDFNEIGEVLKGKDIGRKSEEQRIIVYNYGLGLHDLVYASKIYELINNDSTAIELKHETSKFWI